MLKIRMLVILDLLQELSDEEHILNSKDLMTELSKRGYTMDRRSVYRDIEGLAEYGFDIVTTPKGFYLRNRRFTLAEVMLLISAVQAAPFVTESKTNALMKKLESFLSVYQREGLVNASNIRGVKFGNEEVYRTIEMINYGIASGKTISFLYYKRSIMRMDVVQRRGKRYVVSPYAMVWVQDRYYLISNMEGKEGLTHFRLDRIRDVCLENTPVRPVCEVSEYGEKFNAVDYASKCLNMFGGEIMRITLRCHMDLLNELFDRFGEDIPVKKDGEDHFIARIEAAASEGFTNWVCQYGAKAEVVSPASVREAVKKRLTEAAELYNN
ncbi:MAG: WYL domain-containing transcriptional regulator [Clostridia bacterium]|nr:WYL domain-containing transcriptional regulator [Clostridia bacterium]MBR6108278.1 WYL domain-containing transcriptional regulator [Clostridia bacterium]